MKKTKKKRRLKKKNIFLLFLFILILFSIIHVFSNIPVKGFYVKNNSYYSDYEILKMTGLDKHPAFLFTNSLIVSEKVKNNKLIKNIKIKKTLFLEFEVIVNENKILYYDDKSKKSVLEDGEKVDYYDENVPTLINEINNKKVYEKFLRKMSLINENTSNIISEIKYDPNTIDNERFLVSVNDGNYIYTTLSKFSKLNDYSKISKTLENRNGILYLDYGNYFISR